jgi:shikimate dehydrogenase
MAEVPDCKVNVIDLEDREAFKREILDSDILVNATIVGMKPMDDKSVVDDMSVFHEGLVVADTVYNPLETKLLKDAKDHGCKVVNGKGMLLWQGVAAFKLWMGVDMPVDEVKAKFFAE